MTDATHAQRPVVFIGGWLSAPMDYLDLARVLTRPPYNRIVYITDINRVEWGRLRDPDFRPVLDTLRRTIALALEETGADKVDIIGHSAGGRVARAYLGDAPYYGITYNGHEQVASLVTLGTPHTTWEVYVREFGQFVNDAYPGAYFPHIAYRSVAGKSVRGRRFGTPEQMFAYSSYKVVSGNGEDIGDGVSPTESCFLPEADNLILEGIRHAPYNAPTSWYGAAKVVAVWYGDQMAMD